MRDRLSNLLQKTWRPRALHSNGEFDIIPPAIQMFGFHRSAVCLQQSIRQLRRLLAVLLILHLLPHSAPAQAPPATGDGAPAPQPEELDGARRAHQEIVSTLQDVQRKYGSDAVMMQGHLLGHAIRNGSILEAAISIPGFEERDGKRFLAFKLDTGIIYNDRDLLPPARAGRAWTDIVEATLRKFRTLSLPGDGIALVLGYAHKAYGDEADLRAHLGDSHGEAEAAAFYLLLSDVTELMAEHITGQQLVDRATILVDGTPTHIDLPVPVPSPTEMSSH